MVSAFKIKQQLGDFIVKEQLSISGEGTGDFLYIYFQKENKNTMDIIHGLIAEFGLSRKDIGISGLKDKNAITTQRFSFSKETISIIGSENLLTQYLKTQGIIIKTTTGNQPITIGSHQANKFSLILRGPKTLSKEERNSIEKNIKHLQDLGFPNTFGSQRFGKQQRNYQRAIAILEKFNKSKQDSYQQTFALQAYPSYWFNKYIKQLGEYIYTPIEGSIVTDTFNRRNATLSVFNQNKPLEKQIPTGPMLGRELKTPGIESIVGQREKKIIQESNFKYYEQGLKNFGIWGRRRPLYCKPHQLLHTWKGNNLCLQFQLPVGVYATSLIDYILS